MPAHRWSIASLFERLMRALPPSAQDAVRAGLGMPDPEWSLRRLRRLGFRPATIVDGGAYIGDWTRMAKRVFPDASVLMVEAQPGKAACLERVRRLHGPSVDFALVALGPECRERAPFVEMETGSSFFEEQSNVGRRVVEVPVTTLDRLLCERGVKEVSLIKLDVQGYELEVLKGAERALQAVSAVLLEVSLLPYNKGAPLLEDVVSFMKRRGFAVYDLCAMHLHSERTFQADLLFVPERSPWRIRWFEY